MKQIVNRVCHGFCLFGLAVAGVAGALIGTKTNPVQANQGHLDDYFDYEYYEQWGQTDGIAYCGGTLLVPRCSWEPDCMSSDCSSEWQVVSQHTNSIIDPGRPILTEQEVDVVCIPYRQYNPNCADTHFAGPVISDKRTHTYSTGITTTVGGEVSIEARAAIVAGTKLTARAQVEGDRKVSDSEEHKFECDPRNQPIKKCTLQALNFEIMSYESVRDTRIGTYLICRHIDSGTEVRAICHEHVKRTDANGGNTVFFVISCPCAEVDCCPGGTGQVIRQHGSGGGTGPMEANPDHVPQQQIQEQFVSPLLLYAQQRCDEICEVSGPSTGNNSQ